MYIWLLIIIKGVSLKLIKKQLWLLLVLPIWSFAELTSASSESTGSHWVLGGFVDNSFDANILREYILESDSTDVIVPTFNVEFNQSNFEFSEDVILSIYSIEGKFIFQSEGYIKSFTPSQIHSGAQNLILVSQNKKGQIRKQIWSVK